MWGIDQGQCTTQLLNRCLSWDPIYAPVFYRLLMGHAPLTARFIDDVLNTALQGLTTTARRKPRSRGQGRPQNRPRRLQSAYATRKADRPGHELASRP
jgi:hypothetical protein